MSMLIKRYVANPIFKFIYFPPNPNRIVYIQSYKMTIFSMPTPKFMEVKCEFSAHMLRTRPLTITYHIHIESHRASNRLFSTLIHKRTDGIQLKLNAVCFDFQSCLAVPISSFLPMNFGSAQVQPSLVFIPGRHRGQPAVSG